MNEKLNLVEILKDCPYGTKFYSSVYGTVMVNIDDNLDYPIILYPYKDNRLTVTIYRLNKYGEIYEQFDGECILFPSKEQRDWSKFKPKKPKFDPKTLQPYMKVLVRDRNTERWRCGLFSYIINENIPPTYQCIGCWYRFCIPYNEETKHLVGTTEEAPEYYRYWED